MAMHYLCDHRKVALLFPGVYCINIPDKNEKIVVQIGAEGKKVKYAVDSEDLKPDVSVNITSSDLAGVLKVMISVFNDEMQYKFFFSGKSSSVASLSNWKNLNIWRCSKTNAV